MNKECLKALKHYYNPDSPSYKKKFYMQWIENNFNAKDIKECKKEASRVTFQSISRLNRKFKSPPKLIDMHAKGVERGTMCTGDPYTLLNQKYATLDGIKYPISKKLYDELRTISKSKFKLSKQSVLYNAFLDEIRKIDK